MSSSTGNCFAVINIRLSLTLIDLLLNVRCMYPGIGNELYMCIVTVYYSSCVKSGHRGRCDSVNCLCQDMVRLVMCKYQLIIRSCKSEDKSSNNLEDTYSPALMCLTCGCLLKLLFRLHGFNKN